MVPPDAAQAWVLAGPLDGAAVRELRDVLEGLAARVGISLTAGLTAIGDEHGLTLRALLSRAARKMYAAGGAPAALNLPRRLRAIGAASLIPVRHGHPAEPGLKPALAIHAGGPHGASPARAIRAVGPPGSGEPAPWTRALPPTAGGSHA